jgi:uncharacterized protein (DUF1800 family)
MTTSRLLDPITTSEWNNEKARHLLNRAGFGIPIGEIQMMAIRNPEHVVREMVEYEQIPETSGDPEFLVSPDAYKVMREKARKSIEMKYEGREPTEFEKLQIERERQKLNNEINRQEKQAVEQLKGWWLRKMITTRRPLQEKMTLFWHGHFAVSAQKVKSSFANYQLNKLFRDNATGNFKLLAYEVGITPAMMRYLDNGQNSKRKPNENWARELMELFTLGQGQYTEDDIKNAARAFTGWSSDGEDFVYRPNQHDDGEKVFMGRTGNLNGNEILDIIFEQPAASRFITRKLWTYFAYENPEEEVIEGLAQTLRESGFNLKPMLARMFLSRAFYSERSLRAQIKSPTQLVVALCSQLDITPDDMVEQYIIASSRQMGQDLFHPPNVKGWDGGRHWINTNTLTVRYNLANFLVAGVASGVGGGPLQKMIERRKKALARQSGGDEMMSEMMDDSGDEMAMTGGGAAFSVVGATDGPKGFQLPYAAFDAKNFFSRANGLPIGQIADFLADYFYGYPIREDQRKEVLEALSASAAPTVPMNAENWDDGHLRAAIHLMLSTAEYQLC